MLVLISHIRKNNKRILLPSFIFMLYFFILLFNLIVQTLNKEYIHTNVQNPKFDTTHNVPNPKIDILGKNESNCH